MAIVVYHQNREGSFKSVARITTSDLEEAWSLTNHVETSWHHRTSEQGVLPLLRSSMVGDIFYDSENGTFNVVKPIGWDEIDISAEVSRLLFLLGHVNISVPENPDRLMELYSALKVLETFEAGG